jgi:hypothetical protein
VESAANQESRGGLDARDELEQTQARPLLKI